MTYAASFCMGCDSTPKEVKANLGDLLDLCAVQAANGTAGNATTFTPFGYDTSQHASSNGSTTSGSQRSSFIGSEIGMSGIGMLLVGLAGWLGLSLVTLG
nr:uncharacterized protein CI109_001900 [Kwoniella shandongensis]KAA5529475.1 hypothetical protein CI109_001900 [Kwoniella shandongensis]